MLAARRLTTFLFTPAPATAEIPSLKLISVIRNFLILSVSELVESWVGNNEKPVMPSPLLTDMATLLGITLCVGGTGTVHTDTGVVAVLDNIHDNNKNASPLDHTW